MIWWFAMVHAQPLADTGSATSETVIPEEGEEEPAETGLPVTDGSEALPPPVPADPAPPPESETPQPKVSSDSDRVGTESPAAPVPVLPQGPPAPAQEPPQATTDEAPGSPEAATNPVERTLDRRIEAVLQQLVPTLGQRGPQALFGLSIVVLLGLVSASVARRFRGRLRPEGVLPSLAMAVEILGRAAAVVAAVTILVALLPVGILPTLTWIAIGAAVAVGWSLREVLPDVLAWIVLATEGQLVRGVWIRTGDLHGAIESFTFRSVSIIDAHGQRISIPNRVLLQQPIQAATDSFPKTHVVTRLEGVEPALARDVLREAALLSPWLAPSTIPDIGQDPVDPTRWQVSVRLLEGAYEDDFAGSFPERVREVLTAHRGRGA